MNDNIPPFSILPCAFGNFAAGWRRHRLLLHSFHGRRHRHPLPQPHPQLCVHAAAHSKPYKTERQHRLPVKPNNQRGGGGSTSQLSKVKLPSFTVMSRGHGVSALLIQDFQRVANECDLPRNSTMLRSAFIYEKYKPTTCWFAPGTRRYK